MLTHLTVHNVALAHRLELEFSPGMTVITGETGAGKSIMLDALGLALGDRADTGAIGTDGDRAEVSATLDIADNDEARRWLEERELADESECLLRRVVSRDGRSRAFINGAQVTVRELREIGDMLIDIHSQHEHQSLLKRETHRRLLDDFGNLASQSETVAGLSNEWHEEHARLEQIQADADERDARIQLLTYQVEELDKLALKDGETAALELEQRRLADAESILSACQEALDVCSENDDVSAVSLVSRAIARLEKIDLPEIRSIIELLDAGRIQLQEAASDISRFEADIELDPARLSVVESRLDEIYTTARKHRVKPEELGELLERARTELDEIGGTDEEIDALEKRLAALRADYEAAAGKLSRARAKAASKLEKGVGAQLASLGMGGARFAVSLIARDGEEMHPHGAESIEFLISTNPGQEPRALGRIASGGELSRISLAIQVVTADTSRVPTLVFDEVDVGIGGAVAEVVGALLRRLGSKAQIVCVTHLPQVAAQGHHHFSVRKEAGKKSAVTLIDPLGDDEKVREIARMLGGARITDQSMAHAGEMFEAAQAAGQA